MKAVQITLDEGLLDRLDRDDDVKRDGRSAVIRRVVADYLQRKRRAGIAEGYRRGYARGATDFDGWADEGTWPEE